MKLRPIVTALMLVPALAFAACGDDDDDGGGGGGQTEEAAGPAKLTITNTGSAVEASGSTAPGVTEITLQNDGKKPASAQLVRIEGDHSEAEVVKTYNTATESGKIPDWLRAEGGVGTTASGKSGAVTQELEPGQYYAIDDEADKLTEKNYAKFELSGEAADGELPEAATITGSEYEFDSDTLTAGEPIAFENVGEQPHHVIAFPLKPGKTAADAEKFFKTEKGPNPTAGEPTGTTVIDGDRTIVATLPLKAGNYALFCFIADREGGKSHFEKGMVGEATVE